MKHLGKILKHIRGFNHLTQDELARKLGIKRSYVSEIESGKKLPSAEVMENYASVFNIPLSTILILEERYNLICWIALNNLEK